MFIRSLILGCLIGVVGSPLWPARSAHAADPYADFSLGKNLEGQVCHGQWQFGQDAAPQTVEIYCGAWDRPSAELRLTSTSSAAAGPEKARPLCAGPEQRSASDEKVQVYRTECVRNGQIGPTPVALRMDRDGRSVRGLSFPADWGPMTAAARVMLGVDQPTVAEEMSKGAASSSPLSSCPPSTIAEDAASGGAEQTPGLCEETSYLSLRRRAFSENAFWNFAAAEQDFANLLSLHRIVAPTDVLDEAEILAEVGVNLSAARRRSEAQAFFDRADALAISLDARNLQKKIGIYRAFDALQAGEWAKAETLIEASRAVRANPMSASPPPKDQSLSIISTQDARRATRALAATGTEKLLVNLSDASEEDRGAILDAEADYIHAVALRRLNQPGAEQRLDAAARLLNRSLASPSWLSALIDQERSQIDLAAGRLEPAKSEIDAAITLLAAQAPDSRLLADLYLTLADVQAAEGDDARALETGRAAIRILSRQSETPGFSADIVANHLERLLKTWSKAKDPKTAEDYFQTLSLVWGGAASRSAVQLAARLADGENSEAIRAYQNAERRYRAASARRERLAADPNAEPEALAAATRDRNAALLDFNREETAVRTRAPRYIELLHPETSGETLRHSLAEEEGYLRFVSANNASFGVLVDADEIIPFEIHESKASIDALVGKIRRSVKRSHNKLPDYDIQSAHRLYEVLFSEVLSRPRPLKILHIDASESLSALPFSALVTALPNAEVAARIKADQDYTGVSWFASKYAVDLALGPAAFLRARTRPATAPFGPLLAFGGFNADPRGVAALLVKSRRGLDAEIAGHNRCDKEIETALENLPELPETKTEAAADAAVAGPLGRAVVGADFTDAAVVKDPQVSQAQILVFATHGVLGLSDCFPEPALLTSLGPSGEGLLTASRVLDLNLHAHLVIMSACDTAGGGRTDAAITGLTDGGEALSGLARSFIYAGAQTILATQWKLNAESSGRQTKALLTLLQTGVPLTSALNKTQAALYGDPDTSHPYFWATFSLVGDGAVKFADDAPASRQQAAR